MLLVSHYVFNCKVKKIELEKSEVDEDDEDDEDEDEEDEEEDEDEDSKVMKVDGKKEIQARRIIKAKTPNVS